MSKYNADSIEIKSFRDIKIGSIYIIKNDINDKVYIGQTINPLSYRFEQHYRTPISKCNKESIDYAMKKLGKEHFYIQEIEKCSQKDLDNREKYWIQYYNSFETGYNLTRGGQGKERSILTEIQIKNLINDYKLGEPIKNIIKKYNIDKTTLYHILHKMEIELKGNYRPYAIQSSQNNLIKATNTRKIKIKNIELNVIYDSKKEALIDMIDKGYSKAKHWHNIRSPLDVALKDKEKTFLGFHWEVYNVI